MYGEKDWNNSSDIDELIEEGDLKPGSVVHTISKSSHHLTSENPIECVANMIEFTHDAEEKQKFLEDIQWNKSWFHRNREIYSVIEEYKKTVYNDDSDPNIVADLFLKIVKITLENMAVDPDTATKLLYTVICF